MAKNNNIVCKLMAENAQLKKELAYYQAVAEIKTEDITKEAEDVCPKVYSAILYVLKKHYRFNQQKLRNVLDESYEVWQTIINEQVNLLDWVEKETGIRLEFGGYEDGVE